MAQSFSKFVAGCAALLIILFAVACAAKPSQEQTTAPASTTSEAPAPAAAPDAAAAPADAAATPAGEQPPQN
jgi:hypothetical protein